MTTNIYTINIPRPYPGTDENALQIAFIEPLRVENKVQINGAYRFNIDQYNRGEECTLSPGFKYEFGFTDEADYLKFKELFGTDNEQGEVK